MERTSAILFANANKPGVYILTENPSAARRDSRAPCQCHRCEEKEAPCLSSQFLTRYRTSERFSDAGSAGRSVCCSWSMHASCAKLRPLTIGYTQLLRRIQAYRGQEAPTKPCALPKGSEAP